MRPDSWPRMSAFRKEYVGVIAAIASSALGGMAGGATRFAIGASDPVTLGVFRVGVGFLLTADRACIPDQMAARPRLVQCRSTWRHVFRVVHRVIQSVVSLHDRGTGLACSLDLALMTMLVGGAFG